MPSIRMRKDTENRTAGKLYMVTQSDGWELVRTYKAEWEYVPDAKAAALPNAEPVVEAKNLPAKKYPNKPRAFTGAEAK